MAPLWLRWLATLTEPAGETPPLRRLSQHGQALLAGGLVTFGLLTFTATWFFSHRLGSRDDLCLTLRPGHHGQQPSGRDGELLRHRQQGDQLIAALGAASPGQRNRLRAQLDTIVYELNSLCTLAVYFTNQEAALLSMATVYATIVILSLVIIAPKGVQAVGRAERTAFLTAAIMLVATLNMLKLGEQHSNSTAARNHYHSYYILLQRLNSTLANQQVETALVASSPPLQLTSAEAVVRLIQAIDDQVLSLPDPRLQISASVAQDAFTRLLGSNADSGAGSGAGSDPGSGTSRDSGSSSRPARR